MVSLPGLPFPSGSAGAYPSRPADPAQQVRRVGEAAPAPRQDRDSAQAFAPASRPDATQPPEATASQATVRTNGMPPGGPVGGSGVVTAHLLSGPGETPPSGIQTATGASRAYRQHGGQPPLYDSLPVIFRAKA